MLRLKMLPTLRKPFTFVHEALKQQGFHYAASANQSEFLAKIQDTSTKIKYTLIIPIRIRQEECILKMREAYFKGNRHIPLHVMEAAVSKLQEMVDYLGYSPSSRNSKRSTETNPVVMLT